jgi:hypothetical protein
MSTKKETDRAKHIQEKCNLLLAEMLRWSIFFPHVNFLRFFFSSRIISSIFHVFFVFSTTAGMRTTSIVWIVTPKVSARVLGTETHLQIFFPTIHVSYRQLSDKLWWQTLSFDKRREMKTVIDVPFPLCGRRAVKRKPCCILYSPFPSSTSEKKANNNTFHNRLHCVLALQFIITILVIRGRNFLFHCKTEE